MSSGKIAQLPDSTIRLIAAGEVITRPFNVVKELLENSIDAGSTNVRINIEQGGVKLIEIRDNGHGIARADAQLLCSRYATSKINSAEDLTTISTFGFRGEALASISEMADVEVKTFNMKVDNIGWLAKYKGGILANEPVNRYLQNHGTQIKVTNLFTGLKTRKSAVLNGFINEKKSIIDLVQRYALHYRDSVTISLQEANSSDLICVLAPMSAKSTIGYLFGADMEANVLEFSFKCNNSFQADAEVIFSHKKATTQTSQSLFVLFVNNRLVDCIYLRKELDNLLKDFLKAKNYVSLTYINLKVPSTDVDVNTHPAKATVSLHYQVEIVAFIVNRLKEKLDETLCIKVMGPSQTVAIGKILQSPSGLPKLSNSQQSQVSPLNQFEHSNQERLSILAPACVNSPSITHPYNLIQTQKRPHDQVHNDCTQQTLTQMGYSNRPPSRPNSPDIIPPQRERRDLKLKSLLELRQKVASEKSKGTAKTIKNSVFIGIFDHYQALIQHETSLYAINLKAFLKEQYYQFYLYDLGNFPPIEILPPGNKVKFIIETYLNDIEKHETVQFAKLKYNSFESIIDKLTEHEAMFEDYLSLKFTREEIICIPCIMPDEIPNLIFLGKFLSDLANIVDYSEERECLRTMGRVVADFYSEPPANLKNPEVHRRYHELIDTKLYVAIKNYLLIPEWLFSKENMVEISDTKDLYKVFERC